MEVDAATGLLKTVGGISEDKTAQIAATALEVAAKAMTFGAGTPVTEQLVTGGKAEECPGLRPPFHIKIPARQLNGKYVHCFEIIGPSPAPKQNHKPSDQEAAQEQKPSTTEQNPKAPTVKLQFEITRLDQPASGNERPLGKTVDGKLIVDGILVRAPAPYKINITQLGRVNTDPDLSGEQIVFLPDPERIYYLPLDRTPFVRNETKIALVNGVVQSVTTTRPSLILGIVGVPKTILSALVPLK